MTDPASPALELILQAARASLVSRHAETLERATRVRAALDAYVNALATEVANEFAAKNGLSTVAAGQSPLGAALALRAAVEGLPELRLRPAAPASPPPASAITPSAPAPASAHASSAAVVTRPIVERIPPPPPSAPIRHIVVHDDEERRHAAERRAEVEPLAAALLRDLAAVDLAKMPAHQFRMWAEELAARARSLQDKGADPDEAPGRVIRKLTAIAYEKGIGDVFGLNRKHSANWEEVAERARTRREQAMAAAAAAEKAPKKEPEPKPKTTAPASSPGPTAPAPAPASADGASSATPTEEPAAPPSSAKVESRKAAPPPEEPKADSKRQEIPLLRSAARRGPVVFVGGVVKQEKVALIQSKYGIEVEWVDTSRDGTRTISAVEKRIRDRRLAAVIVLQGLIGHKHFEPLVAAARQVGTPFAYADKAGLGSVSRAFVEIEKQLQETPAERSAV